MNDETSRATKEQIWGGLLRGFGMGFVRFLARMIAVALLSLAIEGCATQGPLYSALPQAQQPAKPGMGRIYVYRESGFAGSAVQPSVRLNGRRIGDSVPGGFFFADLPAGQYRISAETEVERALEFDLASGDTRYIRFDVSVGVLVGRMTPMLIERRQAIQEIRECHFTGEDKLLAGTETGPTPSAAFQPADLPVAGQVTRAASPPERDGANHLPYSNERMAANYRDFLTRPLPRAFAISESGESRMAWGMADTSTEDPSKRAVDRCERETGGRCFLYAVDDKMVYGGREVSISGNARKQASDRAPRPPRARRVAIDDVSQLPYSSDEMIRDYRAFLASFIPRAFAISEDGEWRAVSAKVYTSVTSPSGHLSTLPSISSVEAGKTALDLCNRRAHSRCFLYAVDNQIVYVEDQEKPLP